MSRAIAANTYLEGTSPMVPLSRTGCAWRSPLVLLVDDDDAMLALLRQPLLEAGCEVHSASTGKEAISRARTRCPDLILLDVMMPDMDGFGVIEALKSDHQTARVPVIFLSGRGRPPDRIRGLRLGAVDYIVKPVDRTELLERVGIHLSLQYEARRLSRKNLALHEQQDRLRRDLESAALVQRKMLQTQLGEFDEFVVDFRFLPVATIGGDLLGTFPLDERTLAMFVLDVSGHGVSSALVTASLAQIFRAGSEHLVSQNGALTSPVAPHQVLERVAREYLVDRTGHILTMAYAILDRETRSVRYSCAGHPPPLLVHADGSLEFLGEGGPLIGAIEDGKYEEGHVVLKPGDKLLLYTDGVLDIRNRAGNRLGDRRLLRCVEEHAAQSTSTLLDAIEGDIETFLDGLRAPDDISLLCLEHRVSRSPSLVLKTKDNPPTRDDMLVIDIDLQHLSALRDWTEAACRAAGLNSDQISGVVLAIVEAVTNVIRHGQCQPADQLSITCSDDLEKLEFVIHDPGTTIPQDAPMRVPPMTQRNFPHCSHGMGLVIIHTIMDDVRYSTTECGSNQLTLVKYRFDQHNEIPGDSQ